MWYERAVNDEAHPASGWPCHQSETLESVLWPPSPSCSRLPGYHDVTLWYNIIDTYLTTGSVAQTWYAWSYPGHQLGHNPGDRDPDHLNRTPNKSTCLGWGTLSFYWQQEGLLWAGHTLVWPWNQRLTFRRWLISVLGIVCIPGKVRTTGCTETWPCTHEVTSLKYLSSPITGDRTRQSCSVI